MSNRRRFLQGALGAAGFAAAAAGRTSFAEPPSVRRQQATPVPTITPDVGDLPYTLLNEAGGPVKLFRLRAEPVQQRITTGQTLNLWGFNGSAPGPTIQVFEGDRVRVVFENRLPEPTSIHWHGFLDDIANDGMPGISQAAVPPGGSFTYNFTIRQTGTYFYHSHMAMQEMAGMLGAFIMHPREADEPRCDRDFVLHLQEYAVPATGHTPDTLQMEYNWLVLNGKAGPDTTPIVLRQGERVRLRLINLGMDHHPIHLHGHTFHVTGTEGGRIQPSAWWPGNTVLVGVAQARDIEFTANNPGDWMLHCHMPHHMMNGMSSQAGPMVRMAAGGAQPIAPGGTAARLLADKAGFPLPAAQPADSSGMQAMDSMDGMDDENATPEIAHDAMRVPLFPQDALMEGPMMEPADPHTTDRPENLGIKPGWARYMQGMMTFVRVLPPADYERVVAAMQSAQRPADPYAQLYTSQRGRGRA